MAVGQGKETQVDGIRETLGGGNGPTIDVTRLPEIVGPHGQPEKQPQADAKLDFKFSETDRKSANDVINRAFGDDKHKPEIAPEKQLKELKQIFGDKDFVSSLNQVMKEDQLFKIQQFAKDAFGTASANNMLGLFSQNLDIPTLKNEGARAGYAYGELEAELAKKANPAMTDEEYKKVLLDKAVGYEVGYKVEGMLKYLAYPSMNAAEQELHRLQSPAAIEDFKNPEKMKDSLMTALGNPANEKEFDERMNAAMKGYARKSAFLPENASSEDSIAAFNVIHGLSKGVVAKQLEQASQEFGRPIKSLSELEDAQNKQGIDELKAALKLYNH